jgi:hypothetical protein
MHQWPARAPPVGHHRFYQSRVVILHAIDPFADGVRPHPLAWVWLQQRLQFVSIHCLNCLVAKPSRPCPLRQITGIGTSAFGGPVMMAHVLIHSAPSPAALARQFFHNPANANDRVSRR